MTATLIGATGLIGRYLLEQLLQDPSFDTVKILVRRPLNMDHPKLEKKLVDFRDSDSLLVAISHSDVVFCSVGTTRKKVKGDVDAYRKVDFDIPVRLARFCKMTGCEKFLLVSSVGASTRSNNFYLKLKGETEEEVKKSGLRCLHILRPSLLLGERKEKRTGEMIGKYLMKAVSFLLPGNYKPIHGRQVAKAMLALSKKTEEGIFIHENAELRKMNL